MNNNLTLFDLVTGFTSENQIYNNQRDKEICYDFAKYLLDKGYMHYPDGIEKTIQHWKEEASPTSPVCDCEAWPGGTKQCPICHEHITHLTTMYLYWRDKYDSLKDKLERRPFLERWFG